MCNIHFTYMGTTNVVQETKVAGASDRVNVWGFFSFPESKSDYAGLTFDAASERQWPIYGDLLDADVELNAAQQWDQTKLDGVLTHEIGHAYAPCVRTM